MFRKLSVLILLAGCAIADDEPPAATVTRRAANLVPWQHPGKWPHRLETARFIVHTQEAGDLEMAETVREALEEAWRLQIDEGGAPAPLDDHGVAGPDGRFDVYLWRGIDTMYVDGIAPDETTPHDDWSTFMVLDPWGQYGGPELVANVFHELRHASQATDDWWEHIWFFEAEATMWEVAQHGHERLSYVWEDFQERPEQSLFRDDGYRTWSMYGGSLFLLYLEQHVFGGTLDFGNDLWALSRNPPGADVDPTLNEPDFADALHTLLEPRGLDLFDAVVGFARARWYTGPHADGTLEGGAAVAPVAHRVHRRKSAARPTKFSVAAQVLGTVYTVVEAAPTDGATLALTVTKVDAGAAPVVQVIGQGAGDVVLPPGGGTVRLAGGSAVIAVTMLPAGGAYDPDTAPSTSLRATIELDRP